MKGVVLWYDIQKGYGFIRDENGNDTFVHKTAVPFWTIFLRTGDKVEFLIENTKKGAKATKIKMVKP